MSTKRVRRPCQRPWFRASMVPWTLALGFVVSFTASAGTDPSASGLTGQGGARIALRLPHDTPGVRRRVDAKATERLYPNHEAGAGLDMKAPVVRVGLSSADTGLLVPGSAIWSPDLEPASGFTPPHEMAAEEETDEPSDGATPAIPRAIALSSTTPAPADATPIEVAAASLMIPGFSPRKDLGSGITETVPEDARHRYADLIVPDSIDREQRCLAEAVYFEARSEPEDGQAAVAQVVLNRVKSGLYPSNVCGVVYQNRHRYMGCQFSFACEGKSLRITDGPSWQSATRIASAVIEGRTYLSEVGGATHYHADYVKPGWSRRLQKMDVIGRHIFYQLKRGQT
ncbi:cell wall hydrolase [Methylobacterium sp. Leaf106]|nr:cell wall hydrolase [Methylobacterium sp. Leaf106]